MNVDLSALKLVSGRSSRADVIPTFWKRGRKFAVQSCLDSLATCQFREMDCGQRFLHDAEGVTPRPMLGTCHLVLI